jgi:hypothetical protein
MIEAYRGQRALTAGETIGLRDALLALRRAAHEELQTSE